MRTKPGDWIRICHNSQPLFHSAELGVLSYRVEHVNDYGIPLVRLRSGWIVRVYSWVRCAEMRACRKAAR